MAGDEAERWAGPDSPGRGYKWGLGDPICGTGQGARPGLGIWISLGSDRGTFEQEPTGPALQSPGGFFFLAEGDSKNVAEHGKGKNVAEHGKGQQRHFQ